MADVLEIDCPACSTPYPEITARSAACGFRSTVTGRFG